MPSSCRDFQVARSPFGKGRDAMSVLYKLIPAELPHAQSALCKTHHHRSTNLGQCLDAPSGNNASLPFLTLALASTCVGIIFSSHSLICQEFPSTGVHPQSTPVFGCGPKFTSRPQQLQSTRFEQVKRRRNSTWNSMPCSWHLKRGKPRCVPGLLQLSWERFIKSCCLANASAA